MFTVLYHIPGAATSVDGGVVGGRAALDRIVVVRCGSARVTQAPVNEPDEPKNIFRYNCHQRRACTHVHTGF